MREETIKHLFADLFGTSRSDATKEAVPSGTVVHIDYIESIVIQVHHSSKPPTDMGGTP